ncbi:PAS domain S-box protein, partial [Desulfothermus okinawensis]
MSREKSNGFYPMEDCERLIAIVENVKSEIYVLDPETYKFIYVNDSVCKNMGMSSDEMKNMSPCDIVVDIKKDLVNSYFRQLKNKERDEISFEVIHKRKDGSTYPIRIYLQYLSLHKPVFVAFGFDMTETKFLGKKYEYIFNNVNDAIMIFDMDFNLLEYNKKCLELYGYTEEEFSNIKLSDLSGSDNLPNIKKIISLLKKKKNLLYETIDRKKDGTIFPVETNTNLIDYNGKPAILAVVRDISERKKIEKEKDDLNKQLLQSQKFESLGRIAAGVAHDFNNLITILNGHTEMLDKKTLTCQEVRPYISGIKDTLQRASELTNQLLMFSRGGPRKRQVIDVERFLENFYKIMRRVITEDIDFSINIASELNKIYVDITHLEQILMNLVINARDAIQYKGSIVIEAKNLTLTEKKMTRLNEEIPPGNYVLILVKDTGCGIYEDIIEKIFEPFFTTKDIGKGTGMGLSIVYSLVKQNKGFIDLETELNKGTKFYLYFPVSKVKQ